MQAEVTTFLAHQIRGIRTQRGWSQKELASKLGTTQAAVSRMEDPSYGKLSLRTLMDLSRVFDTGLQVQFVSFVSMLQHTYMPDPAARQVPSFSEEEPDVGFYSESPEPRALQLSTPHTAGFALPMNTTASALNACTQQVYASLRPLASSSHYFIIQQKDQHVTS